MNNTNRCLGCMEENSASKTCPRCGYDQASGASSSHHLAPGTILYGKYLIGKVLGQGGFGITYLAWDSTLDLKLAVKEFFPMGLVARSSGKADVETYACDQGEQFRFGLDRFLGEAKTLARFSEHPNIVTVRDFFKENNTAYMVMNHIEGLTLEAYLKQSGGKIVFNKTLEIMMPVMDALREVHRAGFMHRDISPDNIFINQDGRVVLIDFGAARQEMREKSKSLSVILKAGYAPEEQYRSRGKQGPWTDIYAVAATMYRALTGQTPLEAIDRLDEDDLTSPSQMGIKIEPGQEQFLLKAMAVKAKDRYQTVEEFQSDLIASNLKDQVDEDYAGVKPEKTAGFVAADEELVEEDHKQILKADIAEAGRVPVEKPLLAQQPGNQVSGHEAPYMISKKTVKVAALIAVCSLIIIGGFSLFGGGGSREDLGRPFDVVQEHQKETEETASLANPEEQQPTYDPAIIAALDAEYFIDYENGTIPLGDLPIGARVVDPSWEWEFRTENNYTGSGTLKPVTWIVVERDHYDGLAPHVTLLSEELIGRHAFDNSTNRGSDYGSTHWGDSGTANASYGLRPWLNSIGVHSGEGFYKAFSESFKRAVLTTTVPNKEWQNGRAYSTSDNVFIPSTTELGESSHKFTYQIGTAYAYFTGAGDAKRVALLDGETRWYWTRSPSSNYGGSVRGVNYTGGFNNLLAYYDIYAVRPALNLKSEILVSEIKD